MDLNNLSKFDLAQIAKNKNLLANIGIVLLALVITRNIHVGQVQKINSLKAQIAKENEITEFIDILKASEDKIEKLQKDFQINLTSDKVIEKISVLAKKNNMRISSVDAQSAIDRKIFQLIPIKLRVDSDYHRLGHLISDIENTGFLKVKDLTIDNRQTYYSEVATESTILLDLFAISLKKK